MASSDLSPPGTSTYSSNTLHVGDGTWDNGRDSFLLPNLVGFNFDTMRYNGMGNRFRGLPQYRRLIIGHGVLAAITFLGILPLAVFLAKFGFFNRRKSMKFHVYCQILVLFLSTVVLTLGWFAVGPERSLTNPHHGIGVAIYVLIWVQFLFGWLMSRIEKRRKDPMALTRTPLKVWIHKLLGRTIALLGIIQIPLGLTLYGSPKALFILFAFTAAILLFLYLGLDRYYFEKRPLEHGDDYYSEYGSYLSGSRTQLTGDSRRRPQVKEKKSHWGRNILAVGGALGAYEAFKHRRSRKREEKEQMEIDAERQHGRHTDASYGPSTMMSDGRPYSRPTSAGGTMYTSRHRSDSRGRDHSRPPRHEDDLSTETWEGKDERPHTWRNRLLGAAGGIAALEGVRRMFNKNPKPDRYDDRYRPPPGASSSFVTQTDVSRVQNGQAPFSPGTPGGRVRPDPSTMTPSRPSRRTRTSGESQLYDEDDSFVSPPRKHNEESHTLRNSIATFGAIAGFREWNNRRRERRERERTDRVRRQELENEDNYNRRTSNNYPRPQDAHGGRRASYSETLMTGGTAPGDPGLSSGSQGHQRLDTRPSEPDILQPPLPATAGGIPAAYGEYASTFNHGSPPNVPAHAPSPHDFPQGYQLPPPPPGPPPGMARPANYQPPIPGSAQMPMGAVNPDPSRLLSQDHIVGESAAVGGLAGLAAGTATGGHAQPPSPSPYRTRPTRRGSGGTAASNNYPPPSAAGRAQSASSPPISLKMKVHDDGRHVTLRRLNEEEAAAERAARRLDRNQRHRRTSSLSSAAGNDSQSRIGMNRRNNGPIRRSSDQPITNIPVPPPMSSSAGRPSELNLPGRPEATASPSSQRLSPYPPSTAAQNVPGIGSGISGGFGSPGDAGTGTDVSAFADNRRRRRAERARRLEAARGTGNTNRVEFE